MKALPLRSQSALDAKQVERFLHDAVIPLRLSANGPDGFPVVASHWFCYEDGVLLCALHEGSHMARLLQENTLVGFEVAPDRPPYKGIRGAGRATLTREGAPELLGRLLTRYLKSTDSRLARWLLSRADQEWLVKIEPVRVSAWDYSARMDQ